MAAHRSRPRRWFVRRRRFLDSEGWKVTDTWLNIPLLPRRIQTCSSPVPNHGFGVSRMIISGHRVVTRRDFIAQGILIGVGAAIGAIAVAFSIARHQWVIMIPYVLLLGFGLVSQAQSWWQTRHQL